MDLSFGTKAILLQALAHGPDFGQQIITEVGRISGEQVRLREGSVYPALKQLERDGLVRSWDTKPLRDRGRPRKYYELTVKGVAAASGQREAMMRLLRVRSTRPPSRREIARMRRRVEACSRLSASVLDLRARLLQAQP